MILRPYQQEVATAIFDSIVNCKGLTFSVEIARQGGKNELSAHIEVLLLTLCIGKGGTSIKCSPTFKPQTLISMNRLKDRLDEFGYEGIWQAEYGYILRLGAARQVFLSADETSNVVGHTADILLEVESERQRLGEYHPLVRKQYRLLPLPASGRLFNRVQLALLTGSHARQLSRAEGTVYVAGIDYAGQDEQLDGLVLTRPQRDATVITIGAVSFNGGAVYFTLGFKQKVN